MDAAAQFKQMLSGRTASLVNRATCSGSDIKPLDTYASESAFEMPQVGFDSCREPPFGMRLLSFLSDIEHAIVAESPMIDGGAWEATRMMNFEKGLGRLTLTPRSPEELPLPGGTIFLQAFSLADGSQCLKATLSWKDTETTTSASVYTTPSLNWRLEASRIASAWLEGPPASTSASNQANPGQDMPAFGAAG
jgi:hypothetical protein